jgi:tetratricopeptide (TPR) repeat protein
VVGFLRLAWAVTGRVLGLLSAGGAAIASVVAGVATNRVEGPWWIQVLWFAIAVGALGVTGWLSRGSGRDICAEKDGENAAPHWAGITPRRHTLFELRPVSSGELLGDGGAGRRDGWGVLWPPMGRLPERLRGRDALLGRLNDLATAPDGQAHVLTGLGGVGKSAIALRVAEEALAQGRLAWWVSGGEGASLESSLLELVQALRVDRGRLEAAHARRADPSDVLWEALEASPGWVLVIDGADDIGELATAGRTAQDGNGWIRGSRAGLVVVTSRDGDRRHWGRGMELHPVGWLSDSDGARILMDLAPHAGSIADAEALSARLGGLALALHHAGSQLSSPFSRVTTFTGYRQALENGLPDSTSEIDYRHVVTRTWNLSLEHLAGAGVPHARDLLGVLAWFAGAVPVPGEGLDHELLGRVCGSEGAAGVGGGLAALMSVGLIENNRAPGEPESSGATRGSGVLLHPLVAATTRQGLGGENMARPAATVAVQLLVAATGDLHPDNPANWPVWTSWLPHLDELLIHAGPLLETSMLAALAQSAANAADTLMWAGSYAASLEVTRAGLAHADRLGTAHPVMLNLRNVQASGYEFSGNLIKAERLFRQILRDRERVLGVDHPRTLGTLHGIARTAAKQGHHEEAERLYRQVFAARKKILGPKHIDTLNAHRGIARAIAERGGHDEAERLYSQLLETSQQVLGHEHKHTLDVNFQLVRMSAERGDYAEAERLYSQLLQAHERTLGPEHPQTLNVRFELARMIAVQGDRAGAERVLQETLHVQERTLGVDHPDTRATTRELRAIRTPHCGDR